MAPKDTYCLLILKVRHSFQWDHHIFLEFTIWFLIPCRVLNWLHPYAYQSIVLITKNVWGISQPRLMTPEGIFNDWYLFPDYQAIESQKSGCFSGGFQVRAHLAARSGARYPAWPPCKTLEFWALVNSWRSINFPQDHFQKSDWLVKRWFSNHIL